MRAEKKCEMVNCYFNDRAETAFSMHVVYWQMASQQNSSIAF